MKKTLPFVFMYSYDSDLVAEDFKDLITVCRSNPEAKIYDVELPEDLEAENKLLVIAQNSKTAKQAVLDTFPDVSAREIFVHAV